MKPKEKAKELFNKYYSYLKANLMNDEEAREDAKVCALILVDNIIKELLNDKDFYFKTRVHYYQAVKQEIEKL
jgi:hypothetical protein